MANCLDIFTATTNGTSAYVTFPEGGLYMLEVDGVWSSATATFSTLTAKGNDLTLADTGGTNISFAGASARKPIYVFANMMIKGTVANAGSGTNIKAIAYRIPYRP